MNSFAERIFEGDGKRRYDALDGAPTEPETYVASDELQKAVSRALYLRRPLLLEGEPGCGKTRLAYAVAYELGYPLFPAYIQSTSRARDLLYTFDALRRLYDIQETTKSGGAIKRKSEYVKRGPLGEAIRKAQNDIPSVVLIDEIDKADIDFPNDLLLALDRLQFEVEEADENDPDRVFDALKRRRAPSARTTCR